jgi:hypothetical protein
MTEWTAQVRPDDELLIVWDDDEAPGTQDRSVQERASPLTEVARALTGVGLSLAEVSWALALAPADQAVTIYRDLIRAGVLPPPDLGSSLSRLLTFLTEMGTCMPEGHVTDADG